MALRVTANSTEKREMVPVGTYKALLCGVYDTGAQVGQYGTKHQVILSWELHKKGLEKPYYISRFYGLSFNIKSKLRADMEAMLGKTFEDGDELDLEGLLETACRLQVGRGKKQDGSERDEIRSLMPLDDDDTAPEPAGNTTYFELTGPGCVIPSEVPQFVRKIIESSPDWTGHSAPIGSGSSASVSPDGLDDDIPY